MSLFFLIRYRFVSIFSIIFSHHDESSRWGGPRGSWTWFGRQQTGRKVFREAEEEGLALIESWLRRTWVLLDDGILLGRLQLSSQIYNEAHAQVYAVICTACTSREFGRCDDVEELSAMSSAVESEAQSFVDWLRSFEMISDSYALRRGEEPAFAHPGRIRLLQFRGGRPCDDIRSLWLPLV